MAISATYVQLQEIIADELGDRTDLLSAASDEADLTLSPIKQAIQSAIAKWEREPFYFNETYDTAASPFFTTVAAQEFYTTSDAAGIATSPDLMVLHILISANRFPLQARSWEYLDVVSTSPSNTGQPQDYAYFAEQIRLYPIPDGAYPITRSGLKRFTELSAATDTNVWTQDAFDLIRCEAQLYLALHVIHDAELAATMKLAIYGDGDRRTRGYLAALKGETTRRMGRVRVRPTQF
jgi:hypothetical protein